MSGGRNPGFVPPPCAVAEIPSPQVDLHTAFSSGQVFHWRESGGGWFGAIDRTPVWISQPRLDRLRVHPESEAPRVAHYLALDHDLPTIQRQFPKDGPMRAALRACGPLRILRQPLWECTATFITSAMKQAAHIAAISHTLRNRFGTPLAWDGPPVRAYPTVEALAALDEPTLRDCALGYRALHLLMTARAIQSGVVDLESLHTLPTDDARIALRRLRGVGEKVANCILLFAYERFEAFPVDVWIARILRQDYGIAKADATPARLREFAANHFGPYGGYAQQYLFHHGRTSRKRGSRADASVPVFIDGGE